MAEQRPRFQQALGDARGQGGALSLALAQGLFDGRQARGSQFTVQEYLLPGTVTSAFRVRIQPHRPETLHGQHQGAPEGHGRRVAGQASTCHLAPGMGERIAVSARLEQEQALQGSFRQRFPFGIVSADREPARQNLRGGSRIGAVHTGPAQGESRSTTHRRAAEELSAVNVHVSPTPIAAWEPQVNADPTASAPCQRCSWHLSFRLNAGSAWFGIPVGKI